MNFFRLFFDKLFNSKEHKNAGSKGERLTYMELTGFFSGIFDKEEVLRNVYIKKRDEKFTEIDLLVVTRKGVIVIESKNYAGNIEGNGGQQYWTQTLPNGMINKFYNPLWQNKGHMRAISEYLEDAGFEGIHYHSFIVFSDRCEFKALENITDDVHIIKRSEIAASVAKLFKAHKDCMTKDVRDDVLKNLSQMSRPNEEIINQHISDVKELIHKKTTTCPLCRNQLKEHTNRKNGVAFYGCTSYPKCKYTAKKKL